jgi:hypothetical protein
MSVQILDIVLYSHDGQMRVISLKPGKVNIITGSSQTGKSALSEIIDYCFGSSKCHVGYGPLRLCVAWYGIRLQLTSGQAFIARRSPPPKADSSTEYFISTGKNLKVPDARDVRQTTNLAGAITALTSWVGIRDNLHEPSPGQTRAALSATVRHAVALCLQQQDEIASKKYLFHGTSDNWNAQALKDTLPYLLGAVDDDHVRKKAELRSLREELRVVERRLAELLALRGDGLSKADSILAQARDVGLTQEVTSTWDNTVSALRGVLNTPLASVDMKFPDGAEFSRLSMERAELLQIQRRIRADVDAARAFSKDEKRFSHEASEQSARLTTIGIFNGHEPGHTCPLCAQHLTKENAPPQMSSLQAALRDMATRIDSVARVEPKIESAINELELRLKDIQQSLTRNRTQMEAVRTANATLSDAHTDAAKKAHVLGRVSLYLESLPDVPDTKVLEEHAASLRVRCKYLEDELSDERVQEQLASIASFLSVRVTKWARELGLEHSEFPMRLDFKRLTLVADTADGVIPMNRIGSGENGVGFHLIAHLAIHQWFALRSRPVPHFIFLDQPSQVYFPADKDVDGSMALVPDEDRQRVRQMFRLIFTAIEEVAPKLQIILIEHADLSDEWFRDSVVERWRGGMKLVPDNWRRIGEKKE